MLRCRSWSTTWINAQSNSLFLGQNLAGATQIGTWTGLKPTDTPTLTASQGDVVLYDWNNDGVYDHESIITASDNGGAQWDLVDAHTNNRYHAYWTLAQYNTNWSTTHIVVIHIPAGTL